MITLPGRWGHCGEEVDLEVSLVHRTEVCQAGQGEKLSWLQRWEVYRGPHRRYEAGPRTGQSWARSEHQYIGPIPGGHGGYQKALSREDLCCRKITLVASIRPKLSAHTQRGDRCKKDFRGKIYRIW